MSGPCDPLCSVDESSSSSSQDNEVRNQQKMDLLKALTILAAAVTGGVAINHSWVASHQVRFQLLNSLEFLLFPIRSVEAINKNCVY